jgi:hypothetical protein
MTGEPLLAPPDPIDEDESEGEGEGENGAEPERREHSEVSAR